MVIWHCTYNQTSHNLESSLNRLRIATLQYKSGLRFIFSVREVHQIKSSGDGGLCSILPVDFLKMHHFFWVVGENEAGFSQTNPATWYRQQEWEQ
jgi:hypothetical protein